MWGPLTTSLVSRSKELLEELIRNSSEEAWLKNLIEEAATKTVLYKDQKHGFLLLAHTEKNGTYRVPHNHGNGWVIYGIQSGEVAMGDYHQIIRPNGMLDLVKKDSYTMAHGSCKVYLPGDLHDTKCLTPSTLMFRLTSSDFQEEQKSGRMIKYKSYQQLKPRSLSCSI